MALGFSWPSQERFPEEEEVVDKLSSGFVKSTSREGIPSFARPIPKWEFCCIV